MTRLIRRTFLVACLVGAIAAAAFVGAASANYSAGADVTCTGATYNYSAFPSGTQTVHETVCVDGRVAAEKNVDFTGPTGTDTISFTVPNDNAPHQIEANAYSVTNATSITGLPGVVTLTCGSPPPPPPPPRHRHLLRHRHRHLRHLRRRLLRHRHRLRHPACARTPRASIATTLA